MGLTRHEQTVVRPVLQAARCVLRDRLVDQPQRRRENARAVQKLTRLAEAFARSPARALGRRDELIGEIRSELKLERLPQEVLASATEWLRLAADAAQRGEGAPLEHRRLCLDIQKALINGIVSACERWQYGPPLATYIPAPRRSVSGRLPRRSKRAQQLIEDIKVATHGVWRLTTLGRCRYPGCGDYFTGQTQTAYCAIHRQTSKATRSRHRRGLVAQSRQGQAFRPPVVTTVEEFERLPPDEKLQWFGAGGQLNELKGFAPTPIESKRKPDPLVLTPHRR